jgi:hypothetical protein
MRGHINLLLLLSLTCGSDGLQVNGVLRPNALAACARSFVQCGPAPAIAKPKTITRQKSAGGGGPGGGGPTVQIAKPKLKRVVEDVPMWKVLLLGDNDYEEDPVRACAFCMFVDVSFN